MDADYIKDLVIGMNNVATTGVQSGTEIGRREAAAEIKRLREALQLIGNGNFMRRKAIWTHADTVVEYQKIANAALAKGAA